MQRRWKYSERKSSCSRSISSFDWEVAGTADGEAKQLLPSIQEDVVFTVDVEAK